MYEINGLSKEIERCKNKLIDQKGGESNEFKEK